MASLRFSSLPIGFALALALCCTTVTAKDVRVSGMGIRKCSEWQAWKTSQNGEARATSLEWAQGFIAGHNVYARSGSGPEQANSVVVEARTLATLLDSFCLKNPEIRLLNGVVDIIQSLGGAKINLAPKAAEPQNPKPDNRILRES